MWKFFIINLFLILNCANMSKTQRKLTWGYSGWGVDPANLQNPNFQNTTELDWFYIVAPGKALPRAIELDSPSFMESTCKISALKGNQANLIQQAILSVNPKASQDIELQKRGEEILQNTEKGTAFCRPTGEAQKYSTCECVIFLKFSGGKQALQEKLK